MQARWALNEGKHFNGRPESTLTKRITLFIISCPRSCAQGIAPQFSLRVCFSASSYQICARPWRRGFRSAALPIITSCQCWEQRFAFAEGKKGADTATAKQARLSSYSSGKQLAVIIYSDVNNNQSVYVSDNRQKFKCSLTLLINLTSVT